MSKRSGFYPRPVVDTADSSVVSQAGGSPLTETARAVGLDRALSGALAPWRSPWAVHDRGKIVADLAIMLALGGDCLADVALLPHDGAAVRRRRADPGGGRRSCWSPA